MDARKSQPCPPETTPETRRLLTAADYFLRNREFDDCRSYALRAQASDPTHPAPTQILSIASVLSKPNITLTIPDYYNIFNLPHFESETEPILSSFKNLTAVLNPNVNHYLYSSEAFDLVLKGWSVLSNPIEKARFDEELRRIFGGTFWTVCPYCYHVYEYDSIYEECCLRCANGSCRRGFQAVAIGRPPVEVVENGRYWCQGFMPVELSEKNGGENRENFWTPFVFSNGKRESNEGAEHIFGGENNAENEVKFFEGDGDVMVGFQCDIGSGNEFGKF